MQGRRPREVAWYQPVVLIADLLGHTYRLICELAGGVWSSTYLSLGPDHAAWPSLS
jgi:hypothetical protein